MVLLCSGEEAEVLEVDDAFFENHELNDDLSLGEEDKAEKVGFIVVLLR